MTYAGDKASPVGVRIKGEKSPLESPSRAVDYNRTLCQYKIEKKIHLWGIKKKEVRLA